MSLKVKRGHFKARSYPFVYGPGSISILADLVKKINFESRIVIISCSKIKEQFSAKIEKSLELINRKIDWILIPDGEKFKDLSTVESIYSDLASIKATKNTLIVSLGGGVLQDIVNFSCATYHRGVPFIQVPTTLLSQADIGMGGCAVDHKNAKSLIGTFYQPKAAILDSDFLHTLSQDELRNGISEIINKTVCLGGLKPSVLQKHIGKILSRDEETISQYVMKSNLVKLSIIEKDEIGLEGRRFALDFGHTLTYAIEKATEYTLPHGFALGIGMRAALVLSEEKAGFSPSVTKEICALIQQAGLPLNIPQDLDIDSLVALMHMDQKVSDGFIRFVLLSKIGKPFLSDKLTDGEIKTLLLRLYK